MTEHQFEPIKLRLDTATKISVIPVPQPSNYKLLAISAYLRNSHISKVLGLLALLPFTLSWLIINPCFIYDHYKEIIHLCKKLTLNFNTIFTTTNSLISLIFISLLVLTNKTLNYTKIENYINTKKIYLLNIFITLLVVLSAFYPNAKQSPEIYKSISVVILIIIFWFVYIYSQNLFKISVFFVEPSYELPHIASDEIINNRNIAIATRLLHPKFFFNGEDKNCLAWLNTEQLLGLKVNIIRRAVLQQLKDNDYTSKLYFSFQLHRIQILAYMFLLISATISSLFYGTPTADFNKIYFRITGVCWWLSSIVLYIYQINEIKSWLNKPRNYNLSMLLPLFVWSTEKKTWIELTPREITETFTGDYGINIEKFIGLTQTILLTIYITLLGIL